ncbi:hypothetical protein GmHk_05G012388 [Glycine max]|nr:hypothetical protein GmHk_05G012388 [Glycine max]
MALIAPFVVVACKWAKDYILGPEDEAMALFASGCKMVIDGLIQPSTNVIELIGSIVDNCRQKHLSVQNCSVNFIRRQANKVVYSLSNTSRLYIY